MSVIKKKKHVSKKGKKAWRKHCDIQDVEAFLEDQRLEERLGKFETKPDSELFVIDTGADDKSPVDEQKPLTRKLRKRALLEKPPKCFQVLESTSKVQDPNAKRNHVNPFGIRPTALSKITENRRVKKGVYEKKLEAARINRKIAVEKKRKMKQIRQNFAVDVWGENTPEAKGIPSTLVDDFVSPGAVLHNVPTSRRLRTKPAPPRRLRDRPAIEPPHPGASYNPSYQEHQDLLQQVVVHEQKMMKREAHLNRVTTGMFSRVTAEQRDNQWKTEMSAGLPQAETKADTSDSDTDNEYKAINPPVKNKKKDHKARRKQKEQIVEKERLKQAKINKKKISDIYTLRKLQSSINKKEEKQEKEREIRQSKRLQKEATALPHLNAHKTPIKEPDFVEPSSLSGDLRHLSTKTNLLRERFESLQRRGALAASKVMMKKKLRVKSYFKAGHKVTDQDVEKFMTNFEAKKTVKTKA